MPGIFTHKKIFDDSILRLEKNKKVNFLQNSLLTLFSNQEFYLAAILGSLGPDLFEFMPGNKNDKFVANNISFLLHNGGVDKLLDEMVKIFISYKDKNTFWASMQRAYLYGFISHIIADSIIYPYIFYWSGFPDNFTKKEINFYRQQNLLLSYNIDNYYIKQNKDLFNPSIFFKVFAGEPLKNNSPIKSLLLNSMQKVYPDLTKKIIWKNDRESGDLINSFGMIDLLPKFFDFFMNLKLTKNPRVKKVLKKIENRNYFFSDLLVRYPNRKKINDHVLNFHQERWQYPIGKSGFLYDSIDKLVEKSIIKTIEYWEILEKKLYLSDNKKIIFPENLYTGVKDFNYFNMKEKNPVRLKSS